MEIRVFGETAEIERCNWWYRARKDLYCILIGTHCSSANRSLDIGCGVGTNCNVLPGRKYGLDIDENALTHCKGKGYDFLGKGDIYKIDFTDGYFNFILCSEVLEHVDNDCHAVAELGRVLAPDGRAIITVPAFRFLWYDNDIAGHHFRRYVKKQLAQLLASNKLIVEKMFYWNFSFFLPALLTVFFSKLFCKKYRERRLNMGPSFMNKLFWVLWLENRLMKYINFPFGTSIIALVRK